jgi:Ni/Fe-hydrogenase subunit HybB-like protein
LVRGGVIIAVYGMLLVAHLIAGLAGSSTLPQYLIPLGLPVAAMTAAYTAYLFAQSKGRDLWQNPLLPPHMLVQAVLAGSGALSLITPASEPDLQAFLLVVFALANSAHLITVLGEFTLSHTTAHATLAANEIKWGAYRIPFWGGIALSVFAVSAPVTGAVAIVAGLAGLFLFEHAYVQGGQAVPLA